MKCRECLGIFEKIGDAYNSPLSTVELLEQVAKALAEYLQLRGCHFRLLSRDQKVLEHVASYGLSETFLAKGPVDAERSVAEALKGRTVEVFDCTTDPRMQYPLECAQEGLASLLTVPLRTRGQVIGMMRLFTAEPKKFSSQEREIIEVAASFCASAIVHSMFHGILAHVTEVIRTSLELSQVLQAIVRVVSEDLRCKGCTLHLCHGEGGALELGAAFGVGEGLLAKIREDPGPRAQKALKGECVPVIDAPHAVDVPYFQELAAEGVSSMLYVPLLSRNQAVGVLCVYTYLPYEFSEDEIYLLTSIGEQCALAIRNAQMYESIKHRYDDVVVDFQRWFEHYCIYPDRQQQV